jgi:signal peptidase I
MSYFNSELHVIQGKELGLSGPALLGVMKEVLGRGVPFRFQAKGWSMTPFIRDGDIITLVPVSRDRIRLGDVVAIIKPDSERLLVHRVIRKNSRACLIQGDNNSGTRDGWIPKEKILGKVSRVERNGKTTKFTLRGPARYGIALSSRFGLLTRARKVVGKMRGRSA